MTLHVDGHVTQDILFFSKLVPHEATLTAHKLSLSMEKEQPLCSLDGLSLVSPSPSEAKKPILAPPHPPNGQASVNLQWSLPPGMQAFEGLNNRLSYLEEENKIKTQQIAEMKADLQPLGDAIHLRALLDAWLRERGFNSSSGSRTAWINKNKTYLSNESGIPEAELEAFFERHRCQGDTYAHTVKSDGMARSITHVPAPPNNNDQSYFSSLFNSVIQHSVDEELNEGQRYITTIKTARHVDPADWKITTLK